MAKIDMSKFNKDMENVVKEFTNKDVMQQIGDYAVDRIKTRTRLGKGVKSTGSEAEPLKPLKDSYREQRKRDKRSGKLSQFSSPAKSNLTRTGQMLDSISVKATAQKVLLYFRGSRKDSDASNAEVAGFVSESRPFFNLSKAELNGLNRFIRDLFEKIVKRNLT